MSSDTYFYELRRHPVLRGVAQRSGPGAAGRRMLCFGSAFKGVFKVAQPVAATLDVEDMCAVEQPIEDGGGEYFIACEIPYWGSARITTVVN